MTAQPLTSPRQARLPWAIAAAAGLVALWALWRAFSASPYGDPVATSLLAFEKTNRLTVFSAQLAPVVSADDERAWGLLKSRQIAVIPARVDYTLDLSQMNSSRMHWDAAAKELSVTLPPLVLSRPNLDEGHAQYLREGVWIGRDAQAKLTQDNTLLAEQQAASQAQNPVLMGLAREAARGAMRQNLAAPLAATGLGEIKVTVRFDGETAAP